MKIAIDCTTITVTVSDDTTSTSDTFTIVVSNAAPTVNVGADQIVAEGAVVNLLALFNDKGTADTHTAIINWGDSLDDEAGAVSETPYGPGGSTAGADGSWTVAFDGRYTKR